MSKSVLHQLESCYPPDNRIQLLLWEEKCQDKIKSTTGWYEEGKVDEQRQSQNLRVVKGTKFGEQRHTSCL
ncbi:MAG: hypothetical protein SWJ54_14980 [Cyanobacteriota bacterium]|nr:hypothetical protein [Cyanobacteriota bacterium]